MKVPPLAVLATVLFSHNVSANGVEAITTAALYQSVANHDFHSHEGLYSSVVKQKRHSFDNVGRPVPEELDITDGYQETVRERLKRKGNELLQRIGLERKAVEFKPKYDHPLMSKEFRHWRRWDFVIAEGQKRYVSIEAEYTGDDVFEAARNIFRAETYRRDK